jgi:hypothetical protein
MVHNYLAGVQIVDEVHLRAAAVVVDESRVADELREALGLKISPSDGKLIRIASGP